MTETNEWIFVHIYVSFRDASTSPDDSVIIKHSLVYYCEAALKQSLFFKELCKQHSLPVSDTEWGLEILWWWCWWVSCRWHQIAIPENDCRDRLIIINGHIRFHCHLRCNMKLRCSLSTRNPGWFLLLVHMTLLKWVKATQFLNMAALEGLFLLQYMCTANFI